MFKFLTIIRIWFLINIPWHVEGACIISNMCASPLNEYSYMKKKLKKKVHTYEFRDYT